jgi:hypothetical protein
MCDTKLPSYPASDVLTAKIMPIAVMHGGQKNGAESAIIRLLSAREHPARQVGAMNASQDADELWHPFVVAPTNQRPRP